MPQVGVMPWQACVVAVAKRPGPPPDISDIQATTAFINPLTALVGVHCLADLRARGVAAHVSVLPDDWPFWRVLPTRVEFRFDVWRGRYNRAMSMGEPQLKSLS